MRTLADLRSEPLAAWFEEMERLAEGAFRGAYPPLDIEEADGAVVLTVDLPGIPRESIALEIDGRQLILRAAKPAPAEEEGVAVLHRERRYGDFERSFVLGGEVDREKVTAECHDGVLTVRLPLAEAARPRRIDVTG